MKQTVLLCAMCALMLLSCNKDDEIVITPEIPVTVAPSNSLGNQTIAVPFTGRKGFEFISHMHNASGGTIAGVKLAFNTSFPLATVTNIRVRITSSNVPAAEFSYTGATDPSIRVYFNNRYMHFNQIDTISILFDIADPSVRDTLACNMELLYMTPEYPSLVSAGIIPGQTVTFIASPFLSTAVSPLMPEAKITLADHSDTLWAVQMTAQGGNLPITAITSSVLNTGMLERITVYDGTNPIGTISTVTSTTVRVPVSTSIPSGSTRTYVAIGTFNPVTTPLHSRVNMKASVRKVEYQLPDGQARTNDTIRSGNDLYLVKSFPKIEFIPEVTTAIINNTERPIGRLRATAIGGDVSIKTFSYAIEFGDQTPDSSLVLSDLKLVTDGIDVTNLVKFFDEAGSTVSSYIETNSILRVNFVGGNNEDIIPENTTKEYVIYATPTGFAPGSGDVVQITVLADSGPAVEYNQLTLGSSGGHTKLRNPSGSVQAPYVIYSDRSAGGAHSANTALSSTDWFSGRYVSTTGTQIFNRQQQGYVSVPNTQIFNRRQ